jgi:transcriptional regulator GlxA family with amidase domain
VVFVLPGAFSLDALGCFEIFKAAARSIALRALPTPPLDPMDDRLIANCELAYDVELVGARAGHVETSSGTMLCATRAIADVQGPVDTLIVAGGNVMRMMQTMYGEAGLMGELQRVAKLARRVASVCTGSFLLAQAGLLNGKRATTHWAACDFLEKIYPLVRVERDPIFTRDGNVFTSAGASTGMDLALSLVRDDHGGKLARSIARWLVLYVERPGSQSQLSVPLRTQAADREPIRELKTWIVEHPRADLSVPALAARAGMSVRNFARAFRRELSMTPAAYVEGVRVEAARRKLELGNASLDEIALQVGFSSAETLRRAFLRQTGISPSACRASAGRASSG